MDIVVCLSLCSLSNSLSLPITGSLEKGKARRRGRKKEEEKTLPLLSNLSLSQSLPPSLSLFPIFHLFIHPCSLALTSFRNVAVVPFPPMSGVLEASGESAKAPSTARESLSEKSGRFK